MSDLLLATPPANYEARDSISNPHPTPPHPAYFQDPTWQQVTMLQLPNQPE